MAQSFLNPFEFLGVQLDSSLTDLRKAYYRLALICHPDKGGHHEEMTMLRTAYVWLTEQLGAGKDKGSYEEALEAWKLQPLKSAPVHWNDVVYDLFDMKEEDVDALCGGDVFVSFHVKAKLQQALMMGTGELGKDAVLRLVEEAKEEKTHTELVVDMAPASIPHGYGELWGSEAPVPSSSVDLQVYKEPVHMAGAMPVSTPVSTPVVLPMRLEDYSLAALGWGADLQRAYGAPVSVAEMGRHREESDMPEEAVVYNPDDMVSIEERLLTLGFGEPIHGGHHAHEHNRCDKHHEGDLKVDEPLEGGADRMEGAWAGLGL